MKGIKTRSDWEKVIKSTNTIKELVHLSKEYEKTTGMLINKDNELTKQINKLTEERSNLYRNNPIMRSFESSFRSPIDDIAEKIGRITLEGSS